MEIEAKSLLLAVSSVGLANAQPLDLDVWMDQQVDKYIERSKISAADRVLWCDPIPDCETISLRAVDDVSESTAVVVIVHYGIPTRAEMEFVRRQIDSIRALGVNVLDIDFVSNYELAVTLRSRLLGTPTPRPPRR